MTMQVKKLSTMIAAATFGICTMMPMSAMSQEEGGETAQTPEASGTVTFSGTVSPICSITTTGGAIATQYENTADDNGHVTAMAQDATVNFDCNTTTVDLGVTLDVLTPADADAVHRAYVADIPKDGAEAALFGTGLGAEGEYTGLGDLAADGEDGNYALVTVDGNDTAEGTGHGDSSAVSGAARPTGTNGDIAVKVGSYFSPSDPNTNDELLAGDYKAVFTVSVTAQ